MGGFFSKNIENRVKESITNLRNYEDLRKAKLVQMGVFVVGIMLIFLLFIWSYTKITLRGANCSTINNNYDINYVNELKSLEDIKNKKMDDDNITDYGDEQDLTTGQDKRKIVGDYRLRDFYIKTAYNCCASGSYSHDFVDMCALENCIKLGARCLDFEVYSFDNKPIVALSSVNDHNIKETYNYLSFDSVMEKIRVMVFNGSIDGAGGVAGDPMILHFRIKTSNTQVFDSMADSLYSNFSEKILTRKYSYEYNGKDVGNTKIKDVLGKIVLIVNKVNDKNNTVINIEDSKLYEYINVISGTENMRFYRQDEARLSGDMENIKNYNKERMSIVLPNKGNTPTNVDWRELSHKGNPQDPAGVSGYGFQFIGQCFQYDDAFLQQYHNDFNKKGGSFVLKPKTLRSDNPTVVINLAQETANQFKGSQTYLKKSATNFRIK
jgi:hypothetical protein|tara:strand:+ start:1967 stop:3277 length:1311 start_codon:yes stop_codon:yes gene_type:complete